MNKNIATLKRIIILLFFLSTLLMAQPVNEFKWQPGEKLVYKVDWSFVYLGTVTLSNLGQEFVNGKKTYHIQVVIESNPLLFWLDNQSVYNTYITDSLQVMRFLSDEDMDGVTYNARYDFDYENHNIKLTLFDKDNPKNIRIKNIDLKPNLIDGIGLIQYARIQSLVAHKDTVSTFIEDKSGDVVFDFSLSKHVVKTDVFPDGINTVYFNGELFITGIAGLTGPFETWYSDDSSRVPIRAYMEVFIGRVEIQLDSWENWSPMKLISEKKE